MLVKQELINRIKDYFNLNTYETKVWLALLGKGIASAGEIAALSKIPRSRTYDVLESLEKKGFAIIKLGKPVKYIGIRPELILEKLKKDVIKRTKEKMNYLLKIRDIEEFAKLEELYKEGINPIKRENICLSLKGKDNISSFFKEMIKGSKRELVFCMSAEKMNLKKEFFRKIFSVLKSCRLRVALFGDDRLIRQLNKYFKIKINKTDVNLTFFIVNRKEVLLYLSYDEAIWLNSEFFAQAFISLIERALRK